MMMHFGMFFVHHDAIAFFRVIVNERSFLVFICPRFALGF